MSNEQEYADSLKKAMDAEIQKKTSKKGVDIKPNRAQRRRAVALSRLMYRGFLNLATSSRELESALMELQMAPAKHLRSLAYIAYKGGHITAQAARALGCKLRGVRGRRYFNHA
jgi:hypothetical protein